MVERKTQADDRVLGEERIIIHSALLENIPFKILQTS